MSCQVGTNLVVRKSLCIETVAFEVKEGNREDWIYVTVDGLVGVSEDKGDVEGGEVKLGCEDS